jgi:hypothetical protein
MPTKIILSCLLFLFSLQSFSQSDTALNEQVLEIQRQLDELVLAKQNMEATVRHIQVNLVQHHEKFKMGIGMSVAGVVTNMLAVGVAFASPEMSIFLAAAGTAVTIAGVITTIRSHRFIGIAGRRPPVK